MLALRTSDGPTWVRWCSEDNIEMWTPAANNSAGDFVIRDIAGEIKGGCTLGDAILIYSFRGCGSGDVYRVSLLLQL